MIKTSGLLISRLVQISRLIGKEIEFRLVPIGISYQEMRIAGLIMGEENMTQKDLAEKLSVRPATLSVAISKLEKNGTVKRVASKTDKRVNYLRLVGNNKISKVDSLLTTLEAELTQGISVKDLKIADKVFKQLIVNITHEKN